jgi:dTDP-4-dehydrorhamnose reductase
MLVTGAGGMVAREVLAVAGTLGWEVTARNHAELDITDAKSVRTCLIGTTPDLVLNAAAMAQVDVAESEPDVARRVNAEGPGWLADACSSAGIPLIHLSTDYVFDGKVRRPYRPEDPPKPLGVYGRTKWEGEEAVRRRLERHLIVRTSWVYSPHGNGFFNAIVRLAHEQETIRAVADQCGSPTLAADLARALLTAAASAMTRSDLWGTYHFCNQGETTRYEFAAAIVAGLAGRPGVVCRSVVPIPTSEHPRPAPRPAYSVLDTSTWTTAFGQIPRRWQDGLSDALCQLS